MTLTILLSLLSLFLTMLFATLAMAQLNREKAAVTQINTRLLTMKPTKVAQSRNKAMQLAFQQRILFPVAQQVFEIVKAFLPGTSESWIQRKLVQAGFNKNYHLKVFIGVQVLLACSLFAWFLAYGTFFSKVNFAIGFVVAILFGLVGFALPALWLMQQAARRQTLIRRSLPDFLDLMVICVEAGMSMDMAIRKISGLKIRKQMKHLNEELERYIHDLGLGKPRKEALMEITERTGVEELNGLITALANSFEMGTSITNILRVHSDTLRVKRLEMAKEKANKVPVKMVMPIYIFLFPAIFLTIFGPVAMILIKVVMEMIQSTSGKL